MPVNPPYDDVFDAIRTYLGYTDLATGNPVSGAWDFGIAPLIYENETYAPPAGAIASWVSVILETDLYAQESMGGGEGPEDNRWDEDGKVWFHVFTKRGIGSREARRIGKGLANLFRGHRLLGENLEFGDANMSSADPGQQNANYYLLAVSVDWRRTDAQ